MYLIEAGNVLSNVYLDEAYENWKQEKMRQDIYIISKDWGIDEVIFEKAIEDYSIARPDEISFRQDIVQSLNFEQAEKQQGPNQLMHNIALHKALPKLILKVKRKYTSLNLLGLFRK